MIKFIDSLRSKGIEVTEIDKWGRYLRGVWEEEFADCLSAVEKTEIYLDHFLWHLFSYQRVRCIENEQAKVNFNDELKNSMYVFYQHSDFALILENVKHMSAEDFNNADDVYIVDREFRWTYVKTHESDCGPYFHYKIAKN